jgi:hypothetical protein
VDPAVNQPTRSDPFSDLRVRLEDKPGVARAIEQGLLRGVESVARELLADERTD